MDTKQDTWPCDWLVEQTCQTEDGPMARVKECGAPAREMDGGGWSCVRGHQHVPIEVSLAPYGDEWQLEQSERD